MRPQFLTLRIRIMDDATRPNLAAAKQDALRDAARQAHLLCPVRWEPGIRRSDAQGRRFTEYFGRTLAVPLHAAGEADEAMNPRILECTYPERRALLAAIAIESRFIDQQGTVWICDDHLTPQLGFVAVKEVGLPPAGVRQHSGVRIVDSCLVPNPEAVE